LTLLSVALCGCSAGYVLRAGYEEAKILWRRQPMTVVLAESDLDPETRRKLETVLATREFARDLGLEVDGSFGTLSYSDEGTNVIVVTGAQRTALVPYTWWFPIVGRVPYKGYFEAASAKAEASSLERKGYDTFVRSAPAFSTLGWLADPLLRHQLRHDEEFLVDLILHELYHGTFYVKGQSAFNESLATFAGHRGAIAFFRAHPECAHPPGGDDLLARAEASWDDALRFGAFVSRLATSLRDAYARAGDPAQALAARDALFAAAKAEYRTLPFVDGGFPGFVAEPLNNAVLLHYLLYGTDLDLFEAIYDTSGHDLRAALAFIRDAAKPAPADPFGAVRRTFDAERGPASTALDGARESTKSTGPVGRTSRDRRRRSADGHATRTPSSRSTFTTTLVCADE
jgi:predicted aminopeptidase